MGDVWLIACCFVGVGVVYAAVLAVLAWKTEVTERPDLERKE